MLEISIKDILWSGKPAQAEVVQCRLYESRVICTLQTLSTQTLQLSLSNVDGPGESKYCTVYLKSLRSGTDPWRISRLMLLQPEARPFCQLSDYTSSPTSTL